jgi:arsenate reductase-like glutaredoxin family protein
MTPTEAPTQQPYTPAQIESMIASADEGIDTLNSTRREITAEYSERMRKLRDAKVVLHLARRSPEAVMRLGTALNPQVLRLIEFPMWGL